MSFVGELLNDTTLAKIAAVPAGNYAKRDFGRRSR